jgi:nitroreductase
VKACLSQPAAKTAKELVVIVARRNTWERNRQEMLRRLHAGGPGVPKAVFHYYEKLVPMAMGTGPLGLMSVAKWIYTRVMRYRGPTPQGPIGQSDIRIWAHKSVALAAQTFMLACRAHNLESCPMEGFDGWRVAKILNLPSDAEISMVVGVGKGKPGGVYGERVRFDRKWFVFEH